MNNNDKDKKVEYSVTVKGQDGQTICFKLSKTTALKKLMEAFCNRQGVRL